MPLSFEVICAIWEAQQPRLNMYHRRLLLTWEGLGG
jgi:hypothetical protein